MIPPPRTWLRRVTRATLVILVALACAWLVGPQQPESGPMLQHVAADEATIVRFDRQPCRVRVTVGVPGDAAATRVATEAEPTQQHRLTFADLRAATSYTYRIEDLAADGSVARTVEGQFRTAPNADDAPVRIVAVGDTGRLPWWTRRFAQFGLPRLRPLLEPLGGLGPQWDLARCFARARPDFFLHLGDVIYPRGQIEGYEDGFFRPFAGVLRSTPVFAAIGNHDVMSGSGVPFDTVFGRPRGPEGRYFTFAWGPVRVLVLDPVTDATGVDSPQGRFLEDTLAAAEERWRIVAMHYPVLCASHYEDNQTLLRDFWPAFAQYGVDLVISGHSHDYQRFLPQYGVIQVIAGGGGYSVHPVHDDPRLLAASEEYGYLQLDIRGKRLVGEAWTNAGECVDRFELQK